MWGFNTPKTFELFSTRTFHARDEGPMGSGWERGALNEVEGGGGGMQGVDPHHSDYFAVDTAGHCVGLDLDL